MTTTTPTPAPGHPPDGVFTLRTLIIGIIAVLVGAGTAVQVAIPLAPTLGLTLAVLVGLALGLGAFAMVAAALHTVIRPHP